MNLPNLSQPLWFLAFTGLVFLIITGRYFLVAGIFYLVFHKWGKEKYASRKINLRPYKDKQFRTEVGWSMITALLFALSGAAMLLLYQKGYTAIYEDVHQYHWLWLPGSFIVATLAHETYYYWLHRWMHHPRVFRTVHKVHHDSNITSPWTAFSFHPWEGLLQAIFLPLLLMVLPMHFSVLLIWLTFMTLSSVINHLDIELYPPGFQKHWLGKWLIGATHHSLHHKQFKYNYGLYFTVWDKIKNTESPVFEKLFDEKTRPASDG